MEVLLELLLLTRNPSLLVLKVYGEANFLKMLTDVDHDNLRTVLLQTPNSWFANDVISCHWAPSWLTLPITSAVYSEVLVSIYNFIVGFSVL